MRRRRRADVRMGRSLPNPWAARLRRIHLTLVLTALGTCRLGAQRPSELAGRITAMAGAPVEAASVELVESGSRAFSDALGRYRFRSVSPGRQTLRVTRVGYHERTLAVELEAGRAHEVDVELVELVLELEELLLVELEVDVVVVGSGGTYPKSTSRRASPAASVTAVGSLAVVSEWPAGTVASTTFTMYLSAVRPVKR